MPAEPEPAIGRALARAGIDAASAEEALLHLVEQAHAEVLAGRAADTGPVWMRTVLVNHLLRQRRRDALRDRAVRAMEAVGRQATAADPRLRGADLAEELEAAKSRLPSRLSTVIGHYLEGLGCAAVRRALCAEFTVAAEQARRIERQAFARMRAALGARSSGA